MNPQIKKLVIFALAHIFVISGMVAQDRLPDERQFYLDHDTYIDDHNRVFAIHPASYQILENKGKLIYGQAVNFWSEREQRWVPRYFTGFDNYEPANRNGTVYPRIILSDIPPGTVTDPLEQEGQIEGPEQFRVDQVEAPNTGDRGEVVVTQNGDETRVIVPGDQQNVIPDELVTDPAPETIPTEASAGPGGNGGWDPSWQTNEPGTRTTEPVPAQNPGSGAQVPESGRPAGAIDLTEAAIRGPDRLVGSYIIRVSSPPFNVNLPPGGRREVVDAFVLPPEHLDAYWRIHGGIDASSELIK